MMVFVNYGKRSYFAKILGARVLKAESIILAYTESNATVVELGVGSGSVHVVEL